MTVEQLTILLLALMVANVALMAYVLVTTVRRRGRTTAPARPDSVADEATIARRVAGVPAVIPAASARAAAAGPGPDTGAADWPDAEAGTDVATNNGALADVAHAGGALDDESLRILLVDRLTGLDSRLSWERTLRDEETRVARYRRPATIVVAELEGLDRVVARLGQDAAERIVVAVAGTLRANARSSDRVALLGPRRFGAFLPETDEIQAVNFVERVRSVCELWLDTSAVAVRVGFGWASPGPGSDLHTARRLAEERLDRERRRGPFPPLDASTSPNETDEAEEIHGSADAPAPDAGIADPSSPAGPEARTS